MDTTPAHPEHDRDSGDAGIQAQPLGADAAHGPEGTMLGEDALGLEHESYADQSFRKCLAFMDSEAARIARVRGTMLGNRTHEGLTSAVLPAGAHGLPQEPLDKDHQQGAARLPQALESEREDPEFSKALNQSAVDGAIVFSRLVEEALANEAARRKQLWWLTRLLLWLQESTSHDRRPSLTPSR